MTIKCNFKDCCDDAKYKMTSLDTYTDEQLQTELDRREVAKSGVDKPHYVCEDCGKPATYLKLGSVELKIKGLVKDVEGLKACDDDLYSRYASLVKITDQLERLKIKELEKQLKDLVDRIKIVDGTKANSVWASYAEMRIKELEAKISTMITWPLKGCK